MSNIEACIFDLDGVIVETSHFHYKAWKQLADTLDITFGKTENESIKGVSRSKSLQKILALDNRVVSDEKFQQLMDQKNEWYQGYISSLTPDDILDGIPEFLEHLKELNIRLAIGSSSKNAQRILHYLQLGDTFDAVIDGTKVTKTKPNPEVFLKGARALRINPSDCLVFEDAASGVKAAKEADMYCVGVGSEKYLDEADLVITTFEDITWENLLVQLNN